jgi:hypothetical protein
MIFNWLNEERTPYLNKTERMMGVLHSLAISNRQQLHTVTNWTNCQIEGALKRIRKQGKSKEERDKWLLYWKPTPRGSHVYTLAEKSIEHVRNLKDEYVGNQLKIKPLKGQVAHFLGLNEILCRVLQANCIIETWLSTKEVMSYLYYALKPERSPLNPDALIKVKGGREYFIEYDTGTESITRIEEKVHRYYEPPPPTLML